MTGFPQGTVHQASDDFEAAIRSDAKLLSLWEGLTPLGRNEFLCWVEDAKQPATRERRIRRTGEELLEGKKRPCCWAGCIHRTDKAPSRWQQAVLIDKRPNSPELQRPRLALPPQNKTPAEVGNASAGVWTVPHAGEGGVK